jgi:transcriptional regulator with XRE-family HTH domain
MAKDLNYISELANRIALAIEYSGIPQTVFSEKIGVTSSQLSRWKSGEGSISPSHLANFAKCSLCNPGWLLTGEGAMHLDATSENRYEPSSSNTLDSGGLESSEVDKWKEKCLELSLENRDLRLKVEALEGNTQEKLETQGRRKKAL